MNLLKAIERSAISVQSTDTQTQISTLTDELGFGQFCYVGGIAFNPTIGGKFDWAKEPKLYTNFPDEWIQEYHHCNYSSIDPAIRGALTSNAPCIWDLESLRPGTSGNQRTFFHKAFDFDIRRGISIPIYGSMGDFGMFTFVSHEKAPKFESLLKQQKHVARLVAILLHEQIRQPIETRRNQPSLTVREHEVLHWVASGKTNFETALILGISEKTAQFHLYNSMRKLDAHNRPQVVATAIRHGLLSP